MTTAAGERAVGPLAGASPSGSPALARVLARNTIYNLGGQFGVKVLTAAFSIYVVRHLGDTAYGRYATVLALVGLLSMLAEMGVTQYGIREIARDRLRTVSLLSAMTCVRLGLSLLGVVACIGLALLLRYDAELIWAVLLASLAFVVYAVQGPLEVVLRAYERLDLTSALLAANQLLFVAFGALLLVVGAGYIGLLVASLVALLITTLATWQVLARWVTRTRFVVRWGEWGTTLRGGIPFALSGIGILISDRAGTVMLSAWRPAEEVGWYAVALGLVSSLLMLWMGFSGAMVPSLSRESVADPTVIPRVFEKAALAIVALYLPVAVGTAVVADDLLRLLYTDEFLPAANPLRVVVWLLVARTLAFFCGGITWVIGRERAMARVYLLGALVETGLNAVFIPRVGLIGTALAAIVAAVFVLVQFLFLLRGVVPLALSPSRLAGILAASAGMGLFTVALGETQRVHVLGVVAASALSYAALLLAFRVVSVAAVRRVAVLAFASVRQFHEPSVTRG